MDFLENSENIFKVAFQKKKQILRLIDDKQSDIEIPQAAANDDHYIPLTDHIWAIDPSSHSFDIPEYIQDKINLISSICEFHRVLDPNYPLLHNLLE